LCGIVWCIGSLAIGSRYGCVRADPERMPRGRSPWGGAAGAAEKCSGQGSCVFTARRRKGKGGSGMNTYKYPSPCLTCIRVADPRACENKNCKPWRQWFLDRWALIHKYPRQQMEQAELKPAGVNIGGTHYATPHQVQAYLGNDPCKRCVCPKDLCSSPCRVKRAWEESRKEVFL